MVHNILKEILIVSEKAANIARICRQDKHLLQLLTQEKSEEEKNQRFVADFKTLADVLIQEVVKHHLTTRFPSLEDNIRGEESNKFTNAFGESIVLELNKDRTHTREALSRILNGDETAVERLLEAVYTEPMLPMSMEEIDQVPEVQVDEGYAVWIDPIDSTAEYIGGNLCCALVLIGVYDRTNGTPILGVVNQPFHEEANGSETDSSEVAGSWRGKIYWGVCKENKSTHCHLPMQEFRRETLIIAVSSSENCAIRDQLLDSKYEVLPLSGAGYKLLAVILNQCDLYLCSKPSTYVWDTLACHAILKSIGGSIVECRGSKRELCYSRESVERRCNSEGVVAFRNEEVASKVLGAIGHLISR